MHNGQVGGYDTFRRDADMMIPDALYPHRKGATDSEALFLVALAEGLDGDPQGALERAVGRFEAIGRARGLGAGVRMTCALSDGQQLHAVRYASDGAAPTLYHRWSRTFGGRAVVSEPLDLTEADWAAVPEGTFCTFRGSEVAMRPFRPGTEALAQAS
jgi:glutamine amidotransferase